MNLTSNFGLKEFFVSDKFPDVATEAYAQIACSTCHKCKSDLVTSNLFYLSHFILQPARDKFGAIKIISGYRDDVLNELVGGADNSRHKLGSACDLTVRNIETLPMIYKYIKESLIGAYGELIYYKNRNFIHVALPRVGVDTVNVKEVT